MVMLYYRRDQGAEMGLDPFLLLIPDRGVIVSKKKTIALFSVVVVAMLALTPMLFACNDDATFESVAAVYGAEAQA